MRCTLLLVAFATLCLFSVAVAETLVACPTSASCVRVGFTYQSLELEPEGTDLLQGYQFWAELVNNGTGIQTVNDGVKFIELVALNDTLGGNTHRTYDAYKSLIDDENVDFLLGPFGSSYTKEALRLTNDTNRLVIYANAAADDVLELGAANLTFAVNTLASDYTSSAVTLLDEHNFESLVAIVANSGFTNEVYGGLVDECAASGIIIRQKLEFNLGEASQAKYQELLESVKDVEADALFFLGFLSHGEDIARAVRNSSFDARIHYMTSAASNTDFVAEHQSLVANWLGPTQWLWKLDYEDSFFGSAVEYSEAFRARFASATEPHATHVSAGASASGYALQLALASADSLSEVDVAAALSQLNVETFYGPIRFSTSGHNYAKLMVTTQVHKNKATSTYELEVVAPETHATAKFDNSPASHLAVASSFSLIILSALAVVVSRSLL